MLRQREKNLPSQVSRGEEGDSREGFPAPGLGAGTARGLRISVGWLVREGTLIGLQREYDSEGHLTEVRSRTAVRGGWVGGQM